VAGIVLDSLRVHSVPLHVQVSLLMVAPRPPKSRTWDLVVSYAMFVARGHNGALIRLDVDGHGVAVGEGAMDGVGVGDAEGVAMAVGVGVGEAAASG
jgi:hypothetical protein